MLVNFQAVYLDVPSILHALWVLIKTYVILLMHVHTTTCPSKFPQLILIVIYDNIIIIGVMILVQSQLYIYNIEVIYFKFGTCKKVYNP